MRPVPTAITLGIAAMMTVFVQAVPEADHPGMLSLGVRAVTEVLTDAITLTLNAEQERADSGMISTALSRKADDVINQVRRISGVQAETGGFNIYSNTDHNGKVSVWRGRTEVCITSKDSVAVSGLVDRLTSQTQVQNVNSTFSCEVRIAAEAKLIDQAANSFRGKTLTATKLPGYTSYTIRNVHVSEDNNNPGPRPMIHMTAAPVSFDLAPVSIGGGKAQATVTVSGATQMLK